MSQPVLEEAVLTGERVVLRPLALDDVETAFAMLHGCEDILKWLVWDGPDTPADLQRAYGSWVQAGGDGHDYHFAVCERESGEFAGSIGPRFQGTRVWGTWATGSGRASGTAA